MKKNDVIEYTGCSEEQIRWGNNDDPTSHLIIGKEYICIKEPIFLLWKKYNNQGHYMSLYLKSKDSLNYFK